jgi:homoserine O-acetyltransferase
VWRQYLLELLKLSEPGAPASPAAFRVKFETTKGPFIVEAHRDWAPNGVDRFYDLVRNGFFDDSRFYRVLLNYIAQFGIAGDPSVAAVWRTRTIPTDPEHGSNVRGTIGYAMVTPNARTTQLYINLADNLKNDHQGFTVVGRVVEGMDVVDRLYSGYGETSGGGMRAGHQQKLFEEGNPYLDREFPNLDKLLRATVL